MKEGTAESTTSCRGSQGGGGGGDGSDYHRRGRSRRRKWYVCIYSQCYTVHGAVGPSDTYILPGLGRRVDERGERDGGAMSGGRERYQLSGVGQ